MYKRIKDYTELIDRWKIKFGKHYYDVFYWSSQDAFIQNTYDNDESVMACVNHAPVRILIDCDGKTIKEIIPKKLGEVHFVRDQWNMEVVAHEMLHVYLNVMREVRNVKDIIEQNGDSEEEACYEFGYATDLIYRRLWDDDSEV